MSMTKRILIFLGIIIAAAIIWYLASPLFIDREVNEALNFDKNGASFESASELQRVDDDHMMDDDMMDDAMGDEETSVSPATPQVLAHGIFYGMDSLHQGSGDAYLITSEENTVLRFENFNVTNGPDLYVVLSENEDPATSGELGEHVILEKLKGNVGDQNYTLPENIDAGKYKSAVIYCKAFSVVFARATLK